MRFLIAGPGAVGGFVAARLAESGQDVTVLARPGSAGRLRDQGLRLASQGEIRTVRTAVVTAGELSSGFWSRRSTWKSASWTNRRALGLKSSRRPSGLRAPT